MYRQWNSFTSNLWKLTWNWQNVRRSWHNEFNYWETLTHFQGVHRIGWNICSWLKLISSRMEGLFLMSNFWLFPWINMSFERNSAHKNLFVSACPFWMLNIPYLSAWKIYIWYKQWFWGLVLGSFVTPKKLRNMQYCMMLLEQCDRIVVKAQAVATWLNEDQLHLWLVTLSDYSFGFT